MININIYYCSLILNFVFGIECILKDRLIKNQKAELIKLKKLL